MGMGVDFVGVLDEVLDVAQEEVHAVAEVVSQDPVHHLEPLAVAFPDRDVAHDDEVAGEGAIAAAQRCGPDVVMPRRSLERIRELEPG